MSIPNLRSSKTYNMEYSLWEPHRKKLSKREVYKMRIGTEKDGGERDCRIGRMSIPNLRSSKTYNMEHSLWEPHRKKLSKREVYKIGTERSR